MTINTSRFPYACVFFTCVTWQTHTSDPAFKGIFKSVARMTHPTGHRGGGQRPTRYKHRTVTKERPVEMPFAAFCARDISAWLAERLGYRYAWHSACFSLAVGPRLPPKRACAQARASALR